MKESMKTARRIKNLLRQISTLEKSVKLYLATINKPDLPGAMVQADAFLTPFC